jgi:GT2 family glycosyltransferase
LKLTEPKLTISVVIPTHDRAEELHNCLSSLHSIARRVEIIVADNHPDSGVASAVVSQFSGAKLVREYRTGASYARNAAIAASSGEIIIMLDDDMIVADRWLEELLKPFSDPDIAAVAGNVLPLELRTDSQKLFQSYGIGGLTRGSAPWIADSTWFNAHKLRAVRTWMIGCTGNAAFRSSIFQDIDLGLMEETMGPGSGAGCAEDLFLFYEILHSGRKIAYTPEATAFHRHRQTMHALRKQLFDYSKGAVSYQIQTLIQYRDARALLEMIFWLPAWNCQRILLRLIGQTEYPISLTLYEWWGHLISPLCLLCSFIRVQRHGRSKAYVTPALRANGEQLQLCEAL